MAGLTGVTKNKLLTAIGITTIKLHNADPTEAGTVGFVTGTDKALTMGAAGAITDGAISTTASTTIDVPAGSTVSHFSIWDSASTPVCVATGQLSSPQTFTNAGQYIVNSLTVDLNK